MNTFLGGKNQIDKGLVSYFGVGDRGAGAVKDLDVNFEPNSYNNTINTKRLRF